MTASIIICTRNNARSLEATVAALDRVRVPPGFEIEVLIVDNGSSDNTAETIERVRLSGMVCRGLFEPRPGQVHARNYGLAEAEGELILFIDDDIRPQPNWFINASRPFIDDGADAVIGAVIFGAHLERRWMTRRLRAVLAASEGIHDGWLSDMIGANMVFHRRVLTRVPRFDVELGPGALGFSDDTLFSRQLRAAGYRIVRAPDAVVEHHFDPSRLQRKSYLQAAEKNGQSQAYVLHHWEHGWPHVPLVQRIVIAAKFVRRRLFNGADMKRQEGCAEWEFALTRERALLLHFALEQKRVRNYEKFGLIKRAGSI